MQPLKSTARPQTAKERITGCSLICCSLHTNFLSQQLHTYSNSPTHSSMPNLVASMSHTSSARGNASTSTRAAAGNGASLAKVCLFVLSSSPREDALAILLVLDASNNKLSMWKLLMLQGRATLAFTHTKGVTAHARHTPPTTAPLSSPSPPASHTQALIIQLSQTNCQHNERTHLTHNRSPSVCWRQTRLSLSRPSS